MQHFWSKLPRGPFGQIVHTLLGLTWLYTPWRGFTWWDRTQDFPSKHFKGRRNHLSTSLGTTCCYWAAVPDSFMCDAFASYINGFLAVEYVRKPATIWHSWKKIHLFDLALLSLLYCCCISCFYLFAESRKVSCSGEAQLIYCIVIVSNCQWLFVHTIHFIDFFVHTFYRRLQRCRISLEGELLLHIVSRNRRDSWRAGRELYQNQQYS